MVISSSVCIGLGLLFGCLFLALVAELYYLLWWKKKIVRVNHTNSSSSSNSNTSGDITNSDNGRVSVEHDVYNNYTKQLYHMFCLRQQITSSQKRTTTNDDIEQQQQQQQQQHDSSEMQKQKSSSFDDEEESIESELMRLHNLSGPPRYLYTINEETKEDLIELDRKSTSRNKSLNDLLNESPFFTPVSSPLAKPRLSDSYNNPLFETATEAEVMNKIRSSPPPKFKFLRDAEEKLLRKLFNESEKRSVRNLGVAQDSDFVTLVVHRQHNHNHNHNQSQVLPLYSSPRSSVSS